MRLSREIVLAGVEHPNRFVRDSAANYFSESPDSTVEVTRRLIGVVEQYGWREALSWGYKFTNFDLDAASLDWVLAQLEEGDLDDGWTTLPSHLARMISKAPVELLIERRTQIEALPAMSASFGFRNDQSGPLTVVDRRLEIAKLSAEQCFEKIEQLCDDTATVDGFAHAQIAEAELLLEPIIAAGSWGVSRMLEILSADQPPEGSPAEYMVGLMIILAGHLRCSEAAPLIMSRYEVDWDWYKQEIQYALARMHSDEMLGTLEPFYRTAPWTARLYLTGVLESVRSDRAVAVTESLLQWEDADDLRVNLAIALASQFNDATMAIAEEVYAEDPNDPERFGIIAWLHCYAQLTESSQPNVEVWHRQLIDEWQRMENGRNNPLFSPENFKRLLLPNDYDSTDDEYDEFDEDDEWTDEPYDAYPSAAPFSSSGGLESPRYAGQTIRNVANRPGRNDPCPCGSGKKYKKCCWKNNPAMS